VSAVTILIPAVALFFTVASYRRTRDVGDLLRGLAASGAIALLLWALTTPPGLGSPWSDLLAVTGVVVILRWAVGYVRFLLR
jgi:hypothetical protein